MLGLPSQEKVEEAQRLLREKFKPNTVTQQNVSAALNLETTSQLQFRGHVYHVPPVGYKDGIILQHMYHRLQAFSTLDLQNDGVLDPSQLARLNEFSAFVDELVTVFHRLCRPRNVLMRAAWAFYNPFKDGTQQEIGELLGFFFACRTKSSVRFIDKYSMEKSTSSTQSTN